MQIKDQTVEFEEKEYKMQIKGYNGVENNLLIFLKGEKIFSGMWL